MTSGAVVFFYEGESQPFSVIDALSAPVIGLAALPDRKMVLALGQDGSCAVITHSQRIRLFETNGFPIASISFDTEQRLLWIETIDGSFSIFGLASSALITRTTLPFDIEPIWRSRSMSIVSGLNSFRIGSQTIWFRAIDVSEIVTLQAKTCMGEMRVLHRALTDPASPVSPCLIGPEHSCTFFYAPHLFVSSDPATASPTVTGVHYLASVLISRALGATVTPLHPSAVVDFLPGLAHFLFSETQEIQIAAIEAAAAAVSSISPAHAVRWTRPHARSNGERLLIAMTAAVFPSYVDNDLHESLFRFLCQTSESEALPRSLALIILIVGRDVWSKFQKKRKLFTRATRILLSGKCLPVFRQIFSLVCAAEQEAFVASIKEVLSDGPSLEEARALCALITDVAFDNRSVFGARGSLELARISVQYGAFAEVAEQELRRHISAFRNVALEGETLAIGTADGWLYTFRKRKKESYVRVCNGAIDCVSIGPGNWTLAVSVQEAVAKVVPVAKGRTFGLRERVLALDVDDWNAGCEIVWNGPDAGDVIIRRVYPK
jgi:hypothetical protein